MYLLFFFVKRDILYSVRFPIKSSVGPVGNNLPHIINAGFQINNQSIRNSHIRKKAKKKKKISHVYKYMANISDLGIIKF